MNQYHHLGPQPPPLTAAEQKHAEVITVYQQVINTVVARIEPNFRAMGLEATVISDFKETWEHKLATLLRETAVPDTADEFHVDPEAFQPYPRGVPPMQPTQYYAAPPQTYVPAPAPASMAAVQQAQQRRALAQQRAMGQPRMPGYDGPANLHVDSDSVPGPSAVEPQITQEELHNILSKEFIPRESKSRQSRQKLAQSDGPKPGSEESDSFDEDELDNDPDNDNELNSDLDSDSSSSETEVENIVLCQYEKVQRVKSKWKCSFKDGIGHVNGRDYLFHKGTGEFDFLL